MYSIFCSYQDSSKASSWLGWASSSITSSYTSNKTTSNTSTTTPTSSAAMSSDQPAKQLQPTISDNSEQQEVTMIEDTSGHGQDEDEDHWEDGGWGEDEVNCT